MKNFVKPEGEVVRFNSAVIVTSNCGCWDGDDDWGAGANCTADIAACECQVNYVAGTANCCDPYNP